MQPAGTAWSPIRGDVGPEAVDVAGNQAGVLLCSLFATGRVKVRPLCMAPEDGTLEGW